jgi:hypothetical protein
MSECERCHGNHYVVMSDNSTINCPDCVDDSAGESDRKFERGFVLDQAKALITGERAKQHGEASETHGKIAERWSSRLGCTVTSKDVALMMIDVKLVRNQHNPTAEDNYVDIAGYAALAAELD